MKARQPQPLKRQSLAGQLREQMEQLIREGSWPLGARIPAEAELARSFAVSHNTAREAVQGLIHAGLLIARPGDGTYVTATDRLNAALDQRLEQVEMDSILEARLAIEKSIAALAAINRSEEELLALERALLACKDRAGEGIEADMHFHCLIAECTHNPILSQIYRVIAEYLSRHWGEVLHEAQYEQEALTYHDVLLDALRRGDAQQAQRAVEQIIHFGSSAYQKHSLGEALGEK